MVCYNVRDRTVPRGMQFGKDARTTFLSIDSELHNVKHYGVEVRLQRLEVKYKILIEDNISSLEVLILIWPEI